MVSSIMLALLPAGTVSSHLSSCRPGAWYFPDRAPLPHRSAPVTSSALHLRDVGLGLPFRCILSQTTGTGSSLGYEDSQSWLLGGGSNIGFQPKKTVWQGSDKEKEEELPTARVERKMAPCSKLEDTLGSHLLMGGSRQCLLTD